MPYVSSKDVATAKELLAHVPFADMPDFLDYALAEAAKTRFALQTLGGVKQYLNGYLENRQRRAAAKAAMTAREADERATNARVEYSCFRRVEADKLFGALPAGEQAAIEALARSKSLPAGRYSGPLAEMLFKLKRTQITIERHPDRMTSFECWSAARA